MSDRAADLIERGDLDELTRHVDRLCRAHEWAALLDLRDRCRAAWARGKQLWPVASHAEYRLALEAPGEWAAPVLEPGLGRYALGPLPEVAASTHTWAELRDHVAPNPPAALVAHERVVRGEDLSADDVARALPVVLDVPLALASWERRYPVAEYLASEARFPDVPAPRLWETALPADTVVTRADDVEDADAVRALVDLVGAWTTESNGRAEAVAVHGDALDALAALGLRRARMAEVDAADALAAMAWAAASGGAHGRRRGMAAGRFGAWWAAAAVAGLLDDWPVSADELGAAVAELSWFRFDAGEPDTGWTLRLAVEDRDHDLAWAVSATDARF